MQCIRRGDRGIAFPNQNDTNKVKIPIVQLGLGFKLNTKIGLHTHTNFLTGSRPSRRLKFGMLTLLTNIRSSKLLW